ncbi:MAG TPA: hypothetical protein VIG30_15940 [Ktedonobacterales bacterium]|jgi:hypothetical protein
MSSGATLPPEYRLGVPGLASVEIPDLLTDAWRETVRRAWTRAKEITDQRYGAWELRKFEYQHFYSAWVGLAFRFRDCASHDRTFTASFQQTHGEATEEALYEEDAALFGFFLKGLSVLDCLAYGLYALGALIRMPTNVPSTPPSAAFPLLDPKSAKLFRSITLESTQEAFVREFMGQSITDHLTEIRRDPHYSKWKEIRNVLAHRAASAGRALDYSRSLVAQSAIPPDVTQWGGDIPLSVETTSARYAWLRETINASLQAVAAFAAAELPYQEDELPSPLV